MVIAYRSTLSLLCCTLFMGLAAVSGTKAQDSAGTITGTLIDEKGKPVPGARIYVIGTKRGALSRPTGTFSIDKLSPGTYQLRTISIGHLPDTVAATVYAGKATTVKIRLSSYTMTPPIPIVRRRPIPPERAGTARRVPFVEGVRTW